MKSFSHMDERGRARRVDIGGKPIEHRRAKATGCLTLEKATLEPIAENSANNPKTLLSRSVAGVASRTLI